MARLAPALRQLAHHLHPHEPLVEDGVLDAVFEKLQREQLVRIKIEAVSMDSTIVKVHPDGTGALKKTVRQAIGKSRGGWTTKIHMVAADARTAITFALSPAKLTTPSMAASCWAVWGHCPRPLPLLMDGAYEDDQTRQLALDFGWIPVVPPKRTRLEPWEFDRVLYRRRNELERLFRRLQGSAESSPASTSST